MKKINHLSLKMCVISPMHRGFFLLEALIAVLIFSLGILGLVAMGGLAIQAQSDAEYRTQAAAYANQIIGDMWVNLDRSTLTSSYTSIAAFQLNATSAGNCDFSGGNPGAQALVANWVTNITTAGPGQGLPGAVVGMQQILIDNTAAAYNKVTVTVCWQTPKDIVNLVKRKHIVISYIN